MTTQLLKSAVAMVCNMLERDNTPVRHEAAQELRAALATLDASQEDAQTLGEVMGCPPGINRTTFAKHIAAQAELYRWLRDDDNWCDDGDAWVLLGELGGTEFDDFIRARMRGDPIEVVTSDCEIGSDVQPVAIDIELVENTTYGGLHIRYWSSRSPMRAGKYTLYASPAPDVRPSVMSDDDLWHIAGVVNRLNGGSLFNVSQHECVTAIRAAFMDPDSGRAFIKVQAAEKPRDWIKSKGRRSRRGGRYWHAKKRDDATDDCIVISFFTEAGAKQFCEQRADHEYFYWID